MRTDHLSVEVRNLDGRLSNVERNIGIITDYVIRMDSQSNIGGPSCARAVVPIRGQRSTQPLCFANAFAGFCNEPMARARDIRLDTVSNASSEDDFYTRNGMSRKRKADGMYLMSTENVTLKDTWEEFTIGRNGLPSIRDLEEKGKGWRRDLLREDGTRGTAFKTLWAYRSPIYNLITHYVEVESLDEAEP